MILSLFAFSIGLVKIFLACTIVIFPYLFFFLSNSLNMFIGAKKNHPTETVLLSTHYICFSWGKKKNGYQ